MRIRKGRNGQQVLDSSDDEGGRKRNDNGEFLSRSFVSTDDSSDEDEDNKKPVDTEPKVAQVTTSKYLSRSIIDSDTSSSDDEDGNKNETEGNPENVQAPDMIASTSTPYKPLSANTDLDDTPVKSVKVNKKASPKAKRSAVFDSSSEDELNETGLTGQDKDISRASLNNRSRSSSPILSSRNTTAMTSSYLNNTSILSRNSSPISRSYLNNTSLTSSRNSSPINKSRISNIESHSDSEASDVEKRSTKKKKKKNKRSSQIDSDSSENEVSRGDSSSSEKSSPENSPVKRKESKKRISSALLDSSSDDEEESNPTKKQKLK